MTDRAPSESASGSAPAGTVGASLVAAERWEPSIRAWAWGPRDSANEGAGAVAAQGEGPLSGVPFAVKDVIDVAGMPTGFGWDLPSATVRPDRDAAVVRALRQAGAVPVGKSRSTPFAFVDPTIARNPFDPARTPGGSSSGSGALVGAGVVPFALGTQTAGSLCRPAAYCGVAAYKPGLSVLPTAGMCPLSRSFDAVGVIAWDMPWLRRVFDVLAQSFGLRRDAVPSPVLRVARVSTPEQSPSPAMVSALDAAATGMQQAGHEVVHLDLPVSFDALIADHRKIMLAEATGDLARLVAGREGHLPEQFAAAWQEGLALDPTDLAECRQRVAVERNRFWRAMAGIDLLLALPVPDVAPVGLHATGDQSYLTPWTVLGGPLVTLPAGADADGLPLSVMLAGAPGQDVALMEMAEVVAGLLPPPVRPTL